MSEIAPAIPTRPLTFEAVYERFLTFREAEMASPNTMRGYVYARQQWQDYAFERGTPRDLSQLEDIHVVGFLGWLRTGRSGRRPLKSQTVSYYFRSLRAFLSWATRKGFLDPEVTRDLKPPKVEQTFPEVLTEPEAAALVNACVRPVESAVVTLLLDSGLRVSELVSLKRGDVSAEEEGLKVLGKGAKERVVSLSPSGYGQLAEYLSVTAGAPDAPLFQGVRGPLTSSGINQMLHKLAKRAGLRKRVTPHILRHTFATHYVQNGGNVHGLMDELGHATLEMARRYVHLALRGRRDVKRTASIFQRLTDARQAA